MNQIEVHPYFANEAAREASHRHGALVESWSPIAQGAVLDDEVIGKIAAAHGRTPSQVTLRWHVERGDIVFPKTMHRERMEENFAIFDFELTPDEVAAISALDRGEDGRTGPNPDTFDYVPALSGDPRPGPDHRRVGSEPTLRDVSAGSTFASVRCASYLGATAPGREPRSRPRGRRCRGRGTCSRRSARSARRSRTSRR